MKRMAVLLLFCMLLLTGCMSRHVEEQLLVIVMGVDVTEKGDIALTVKVPSNTVGENGGTSNKKAEEGGNQMGYLTLSATGHKFGDALELLQATTPRSLNFSQTREVVLSMDLAKTNDCNLLLQQVYALPRMHNQALVVVCEGEAQAFVEEQKPYVGSRLSRYIDVSIINYAGKGFVPTTSLAQAVHEMGFGWRDPLLILGALGDGQGPPRDGNVLDTDVGDLHKTSVNAVKMFGAAVTNGQKVSGTLTGYEMALINLIRGNAQALSLSDEEGFSLPLYVRSPAALDVTEGENGEPLQLSVELLCEVHYTAPYPPDGEELQRQLQQDIENTLKKLQSMGCDALGFGGKMVRKFATVQQWEDYHFREKYVQADVQVTVHIRLKKE